LDVAERSTVERSHFGIDAGNGLAARWRRAALEAAGLGKLLWIREQARSFSDPFELADFTLRELRITVRAEAAAPGTSAADALPASGPLVVMANHPFGGVDGLSAISTIGRARRDLRVLANPELMQIEGLQSLVIPLDPFGNKEARRTNSAGLRAALRWLCDGGALLIFPAGEVSHFTLRKWSITDGEWHTTAARLIRHSGATVSPMFFSGHNSAMFQLAGFVHPMLRTLLLPSEMARRADSTIDVRVGAPLDARALAPFATDEALTANLRFKTYLLGSNAPGVMQAKPRATSAVSIAAATGGELEPLAPQVAPDVLAKEIAALPHSATLVTAGDQHVICAPARLIPNTLQELGRLRELSFRGVGEGTGRSADIDVFDDYYEHLFVWNPSKREIVGAYRLGRVDEIRRRFGARGLYTSTLFDYREPFLTLLGPALELGRSFVRPEHQKSFAALLLLWKGIGEYIGRNPRYVRLIGPVSISDSYSTLSKELLVRYLRARSFDHFGATLVKAKSPFRHRKALRSLGLDIGTMPDLDAVSTLVAGLESDRKGVPVLLRQYLKLGGRLLGFNVDGDFNDAIDCLLVIDLRQTDARMLRKYLSDEALTRFAVAHRMKALLDAAA
jgi:putative hemolysin